jgi:hypothetical protein
MEIEVSCPFCGEAGALFIDVSAGRRQQYVEDCWVCCRPMEVTVVVHAHDEVDVSVQPADE